MTEIRIFIALLFLLSFSKASASPQEEPRELPTVSLETGAKNHAEYSVLAKMAQARRNDGFTVLVWNVQGAGVDPRTLNHNLSAVIGSEMTRPSMIILLEYKHNKTFSKATKSLIDSIYPFRTYYNYNEFRNGPEDRAIFVASLETPEQENLQILDWTSRTDSEEDAEEFRAAWWDSNEKAAEDFKRPLGKFVYEIGGQKIAISGIHLNNPWAFIRNKKYGNADLACCFFLGKENPSLNQVIRLVGVVKKWEEPALIAGDFNISHKANLLVDPDLRWLDSAGFLTLDGALTDIKVEHRPTFPTPSAEKLRRFRSKKAGRDYEPLPKVEIDHSWVSKGFPFKAKSFSVDWSGSDHRAQVIVVEP